jgi:hypothetical protein
VQDKPGFVPVDPNATYRLVNGGTDGDVVYSGAGEEGLRSVFEQANKLTLDDPKNAYWGVEVLNPETGKYERVAENQGPNGLGIVGDIAGIALPIAAAIATGGASLGVQIAAGAAAGALGGFLSGKDILTSALISGATAGIGNVSGFNDAVGGVLKDASSAVKDVFVSEAAKEAAKQAITSAGGDIVVTGLGTLAKGLGAGVVQGATSGLTNGLGEITGYQTPADKFAQEPLPEAVQPTVPTPVEDAIVVTGARPGAVADTAADIITGIGSGAAADVVSAPPPPPAAPPAEEPAPSPVEQPAAPPVAEEPPIIVSGVRPDAVTDTAANVISGIGSGVADAVIQPPAPLPPPPPVEELPPVETPPIEEPPATIVTGAKPDAIADAVAGIGGSIIPVPVPPSTVATETLPGQTPIEEEPPATIVTGAKPDAVADAVASIGGSVIQTFDPNAPIVVTAPKVVEQPQKEPEQTGIGTPGFIDPITGDIVVSKPQPETVNKEEPVGPILPTLGIPEVPTPDPALTDPKSTLDKVKDAYDIARAVSPLVPLVAGGGGGGDGVALVPKGGRYEVNPNRSDTFGTRGIANIGFDPFTYGQATGDQPGEYMFFTRNPVTETPAPITTPAPDEAAGPAGYIPPSNVFAEGGEINDDMASHLMAYHKNGGHTGPGQVKGIGSGQEDKIPAWLSDGEYVWSAQDVADLGDGSTDEGVRRLDKMRHMVRRRAGRKDVKKIAKPQKGIDHILKAVGGSN